MTTSRQRRAFSSATPKAAEVKPLPVKVTLDAVAASSVKPRTTARINPFAIPKHPPGVSDGAPKIAQDDALGATSAWAAAAYASAGYGATDGVTFIGYPILAELAQRPEYRRITETIATEMTRRWVRITANDGAEDKGDRIAAIEDALKRLNAQDAFRRAAENDGYMGRGHLYLDFGTTDDPEELKSPIGDGREAMSRNKVAQGDLKRLQPVEAIWCYPGGYNTTDPLAANWYKPTCWYIQGKQVHHSRILTFIGREVPDLLKPTYSFGGLSMSQMAQPYVDNWLRTRQSVSDLIRSFSVSGVKIDLANALALGGADQLFQRIDMFNNLRDNRGTMVLNKGTASEPAEEFFNVSTALGTLDHLQAQAQEHMASVSGIPLVKLLGITPSGLNASADGEIRVFYDHIHSLQEKLFTPNFQKLLDFVMLSEFGEIDEDIGFSWEPLWQMSDAEKAEVAEVKTRSIIAATDAGVIDNILAMRELQEMAESTGLFTQITDEDITEAEANPPMPEMEPGAENGMNVPGLGREDQPDQPDTAGEEEPGAA